MAVHDGISSEKTYGTGRTTITRSSNGEMVSYDSGRGNGEEMVSYDDDGLWVVTGAMVNFCIKEVMEGGSLQSPSLATRPAPFVG
ncbi:hypothetical protein L6452_09576 [Arctium lappa]|uniref:Uncharacterized protein n=1 Tax=Arctium lappa TaxID=4217 RepID=A0ACB9DKD3_ARCLA|nr:hypothetical protein L6452_09576 [Arctium lappa]